MKKVLLTLVVLFLIGALLAGIGFFGYRFYKNRNSQVPGISKEQSEQKSQAEKKKERKEKQEVLIEIIKEVFIAQSPGTSISLAVHDLKNNEYFGLNDTEIQHAASVSKILTSIYVFAQVEKGKTTLNEPMGAYVIETQIQYLINQSSQDSWDLLDAKFKPEDQNAYAKTLGLTGTDVRRGKNLMSAKDISILLQKLADGEILTQNHRDKLFSYMQKTEGEDFFSPAFKLQRVSFYHKTGKYLGEGHDAAIVNHQTNPFVLVLFTNNNTNTNLIGRGVIMTKIAQTVYEYFDSLD